MLTLSPIHDISYYIELHREDYYTVDGEPDGTWTDHDHLNDDEEVIEHVDIKPN
jgi:hypothetical protein